MKNHILYSIARSFPLINKSFANNIGMLSFSYKYKKEVCKSLNNRHFCIMFFTRSFNNTNSLVFRII